MKWNKQGKYQESILGRLQYVCISIYPSSIIFVCVYILGYNVNVFLIEILNQENWKATLE